MLFNVICLTIPFVALVATVIYYIARVKAGMQPKSALFRQLICFVCVAALSICLPIIANAAEGENVGEAPEEASVSDISVGMGYLAAALVTGLAGIGGGIAVASAAPAAIGATSEDPKAFGKALIFVVLGEGIAIYGLLVSILILNNL